MTTIPQRPIFLKLGGSLITDKAKPQTPRAALLADLVQAIAAAWQPSPGMRLVLGHGSGSFGHVPAMKFGTRQGVSTAGQWQGFAEVWYQAAALNRLVMEACHRSRLPAISFPPSASVITRGGKITSWDTGPIVAALEAGLMPVVYGDVVLDTAIGGTILSTEDLFVHLAGRLRPSRILLAGLETGVWADFPESTKLLRRLTPANRTAYRPYVQGALETDVTGGMATKVDKMLELVEIIPDLRVQIFSGKQPDTVNQALLGAAPGTTLQATLREP